MSNLTLIIPAKKEAESLPVFLKELENYNFDKMIVLQSEDIETIEAIKEFKNVRTYVQKNSGYGNALKEGIQNTESKFFCIINADGSMDPKYLGEMLELCSEKDLIFASRYLKNGGSDDDDLITLIGNYFFTKIGNIFFSLKITDILFTYVMGKTHEFNNLDLKSNDFTLCVEFPIKAKRYNYKLGTIPSYERSRIGGKKKVNALKDGLLILIKMIKMFFIK